MLTNIKCTPLPVVFVSTHILYPSAHSVILLCLSNLLMQADGEMYPKGSTFVRVCRALLTSHWFIIL